MSLPKNILVIIIAALTVFGINSCKKQEVQQDAQIEVIAPKENSFYTLPDTIHVEVIVTTENQPNYIRICVCNSQQTPAFAPVYFYPEKMQTQLSFDYILENRDVTTEGQLYFQVTVATGILTNSFTKIQIEGHELKYKGFYLFTRPSVNETKVVFVDTELVEQNIASVSGNFKASATSIAHDMLYFLAETPGRIYANQYSEEPFSWVIEPTADFPEFTSLSCEGNKVYCGYGNGKIAGFADVSGQQLVSTPVMIDSVPENLIVTDMYIVGDFRQKNKTSRSLSVFYKITGARFQKVIHYIEVLDFYTENEQKELILFGNEDGKAVVSHYFLEGNYFSESLVVSEESMSSSCRVGESVFLFSSNNRVFSIDLKTLIQKELVVLGEEIISVEYDETEQTVFIATANSVYFHAYPAMQLLKRFISNEPIKGIELRYAY